MVDKTLYQLCVEAVEAVCIDAGLVAVHDRKLSKASYGGSYEIGVGEGEIPERDSTCSARKVFSVDVLCRLHCGGNVGKAKIDAYVLRTAIEQGLCNLVAPPGVARLGIPIKTSKVEYNEDGAEFVTSVTAEIFEVLA